MSETDESEPKYKFRGKFGVASSPAQVEEPTHEEIDRFVKSILGLNKEEE